ncbi:MAG: hypothetical protein EU521_01795 [Promethearchaeota archaeon]|nr:MAG: hypothetical protein EU521_01795 [Candidatus Lokiarchaeota archaeon]
MGCHADDLLDLILQAGYNKDNIQRRLDELRDFMSEETALFFLARELDIDVGSFLVNSEMSEEIEIDYDEFRVNISELTEGMTNIVVLGRIKKVFPMHNFTRKDGTSDVVRSFIINDNTGECKVVLWGIRNVKVSESKFFKFNEVIRIIADYSKLSNYNNIEKMELHVGFKGKIILAPGDVDYSRIPKLDESLGNDSPNQNAPKIREFTPIAELHKYDGFFSGKIKGKVLDIQPILPIKSKKNRDIKLLLKFTLSDGISTIIINAWNERSLECAKTISVGDNIELYNVIIKFDKYLHDKVLNLHSKSILNKINEIN